MLPAFAPEQLLYSRSSHEDLDKFSFCAEAVRDVGFEPEKLGVASSVVRK